jgi:oligopeptide transport system permease protein
MIRFTLRRLLWLIPVILVVSAITFILMYNTPGGLWDRNRDWAWDQGCYSEGRGYSELCAALDMYSGPGKPPWRQFMAYVIGDTNLSGEFKCGVVCLNFGPSYRRRGVSVQAMLFSPPKDGPFFESKFGYSTRLGLLSITMAIAMGIPLGVVSALKQNTWVDYLSLFIVAIGISVPSFILAIFLVILFGFILPWISIAPDNWDSLSVWLMPAVVLGFGTMARTARLTRSSMLEVIRKDYIHTARAKGLPERVVIYRHMIKNALIPIVACLGPALAGVVTGAITIEMIFNFPGLGHEYVTSILNRDYSMIMGITILFAVLVALANLSVDIVHVFLDPRIRLSD